jgi:hypothetical protein
MTVIEKLSDRNNLIIEAIPLVIKNIGYNGIDKLQWQLFEKGIYIKIPLLRQAISVLIEKKILYKQDPIQNEVLQQQQAESETSI